MNNTIGNIPVLPAAQKVSVPAPKSTVKALPELKPQATQQPEVLSARAVEQRVSAAQRPTQPIANLQVLGTGTFVSLWIGDKLITRYRADDGTVKYIPEPDVMAESNAGGLVNMKA